MVGNSKEQEDNCEPYEQSKIKKRYRIIIIIKTPPLSQHINARKAVALKKRDASYLKRKLLMFNRNNNLE